MALTSDEIEARLIALEIALQLALGSKQLGRFVAQAAVVQETVAGGLPRASKPVTC
jgi:hypothetical protein